MASRRVEEALFYKWIAFLRMNRSAAGFQPNDKEGATKCFQVSIAESGKMRKRANVTKPRPG